MEPSRNPSVKRSLDHGSPDSPLMKRLRPEDLLELLEHDAEVAVEEEERGAGGENDLKSVIRSFEEEIARDGELGFLLHASDDELGLPPPRDSAESAPPEPEREVAAGGGAAEEESGGDAGLGFGWCDDGLFGPLDLLTDLTWQPMPAL